MALNLPEEPRGSSFTVVSFESLVLPLDVAQFRPVASFPPLAVPSEESYSATTGSAPLAALGPQGTTSSHELSRESPKKCRKGSPRRGTGNNSSLATISLHLQYPLRRGVAEARGQPGEPRRYLKTGPRHRSWGNCRGQAGPPT